MSKKTLGRPKLIKRFEKQGVTYTYCRKTGRRLPNLPLDHPDMIAAVKQARQEANTGTKAVSRFGFISDLSGVTMQDFDTSKKVDAVVFTVMQAVHFLHAAKPGNTMIYHSGNLAVDSAKYANVADLQRYVFLAAEMNLVTLRQSRSRKDWTNYCAVRTHESLIGTPAHVIQGRITPDEYIALIAINERQASFSVTRAIRDALAISDAAATDMRNGMIRNGWLTNGRPPELTDLGLGMLA